MPLASMADIPSTSKVRKNRQSRLQFGNQIRPIQTVNDCIILNL